MNKTFLSNPDFMAYLTLSRSLHPERESCRLLYEKYVCEVFPHGVIPTVMYAHNIASIHPDTVIEVNNEYLLIRYPSKL